MLEVYSTGLCYMYILVLSLAPAVHVRLHRSNTDWLVNNSDILGTCMFLGISNPMPISCILVPLCRIVHITYGNISTITPTGGYLFVSNVKDTRLRGCLRRGNAGAFKQSIQKFCTDPCAFATLSLIRFLDHFNSLKLGLQKKKKKKHHSTQLPRGTNAKRKTILLFTGI